MFFFQKTCYNALRYCSKIKISFFYIFPEYIDRIRYLYWLQIIGCKYFTGEKGIGDIGQNSRLPTAVTLQVISHCPHVITSLQIVPRCCDGVIYVKSAMFSSGKGSLQKENELYSGQVKAEFCSLSSKGKACSTSSLSLLYLKGNKTKQSSSTGKTNKFCVPQPPQATPMHIYVCKEQKPS